MNDLIEALRIFAKYTSRRFPTQCEHDLLIVCGVPVLEVSEEDKLRLAELGFTPGHEALDEWDEEKDCFIINEESDTWTSDRFGSC